MTKDKKITKYKTSPLLRKESQSLLKKIEKKLDGKILAYHVDSSSSICDFDVQYLYAHLKKIGKQKKLYFIIISPGGDGQAAWRMAYLLRSYCEELVVVIPEIAASAATMLSLAADKIIMTPLAYLTAVDTSLIHPLNPKDSDKNPVKIELDEVKRAVDILIKGQKTTKDLTEAYKIIFDYIHPITLGAVQRSANLSEMLCADILDLRKKKLNSKKKEKLIKKLNTGYPTHGYPITRHKAKELGLNVEYSNKDLDDMLWELLKLYTCISEPQRTDMNNHFIHTESVVRIIESENSRFVRHEIYERRLDKIVKKWYTFKDEFKWLSIFEKKFNGKKKIVKSELDF